MHDWRADPLSRGAYSYPRVGYDDVAPFDVDGTLHFAGEALAGAEIGTVEGALRTGREAARSLIARDYA